MAHNAGQMRVLAIAAGELQPKLRQQIASLGMMPVLVSSALKLRSHLRAGEEFQVVLVPASLPNTEDWWAIWGELAMLRPRPAILVYAHAATFQLWSGVVDAGGYDVIAEPLTDRKLRDALLRAAGGSARKPAENAERDALD